MARPLKDKETPEEQPAISRPFYEEWEVKITTSKIDGQIVTNYEKMKKRRPRVLISDYQADILNEGVLHGGNNHALMYFLPE